MSAAFDLAPLIVALPALSFAISLAVSASGRDVLPKGGAIPGILALAGSLLLSVWAFVAVGAVGPHETTLYTWATGVDPETTTLTFGLLLDPLSTLMAVIVSLIAFLVHVFSLGYMNDEGETGLPRYYAGLGLFSASMLGFVIADNLLVAFIFFELVGLCSWWLIGFWFRDPAPASAAKKAFLVTRFGDYFFLIGVVAVFATFGTARFAGEDSFPVLAATAVEEGAGAVDVTTFGFAPETWFTIVGLLILGGVIGKSAQFPLQTWLPDAMEGPTPVSALIHAATMVAAGVYLVARMYGFYAVSPTALAIIALIGGFTALFAATMGVVKREIKQVLAYSTISQYGYMMLGLGVGGYVAAVFHLMTHAFFKALLFLGAGAVIVAMHHDENMWNMGGLKDRMPVTYWTFLAGSLALAGIAPFAGFWSKDEVLFEALVHGLGTAGIAGTLVLLGYAFGLVAVFVTGFYTFRMHLLTFHGEPRTEAAENAHGVGWNMKVPMIVLGALAVVGGVANLAPVEKVTGLEVTFLHSWLDRGFADLTAGHYADLLPYGTAYLVDEVVTVLAGAGLALGLALAGVLTAWVLYNVPEPNRHTDRLGGVKTVLFNNYYQDEYQVWLANTVGMGVARLSDGFDRRIVDGAVNGVSRVSLLSGDRLRRLQTGVVSNYVALITLGLVVLLVVIAVAGGWFV